MRENKICGIWACSSTPVAGVLLCHLDLQFLTLDGSGGISSWDSLLGLKVTADAEMVYLPASMFCEMQLVLHTLLTSQTTIILLPEGFCRILVCRHMLGYCSRQLTLIRPQLPKMFHLEIAAAVAQVRVGLTFFSLHNSRGMLSYQTHCGDCS